MTEVDRPLSRAEQVQEIIKCGKAGETFYVPGEHDTALDDGALYHQRFGQTSAGRGSGSK